MRTLHTITAGLLFALGVQGQSMCDSVLHASFNATPASNNTVAFSSTSWSAQPNGTTYWWSFGDGQTGNGPNATHQYAASGNYVVCLFAVYANCADSACALVGVGTPPNPCQELNPGFTVTSNGSTAWFDNASSSNNIAYMWDFGDGSSASGPDPIHTYAQFGQYLACLKVWTWNPILQDTCYADHCAWVTIQPDTTPAPCTLLDSTFSVSVNGLVAGFQQPIGADAVSHFWDFGDGTSGSSANPVHTYATPGQYYACLTETAWDATSQDVCLATHCEWVIVVGDSASSPCDVLNAGFQVTTSGSIATFHSSFNVNQNYLWDFGDGTTGYGPNPVHEYFGAGTYHPCLFAWSWDTQSQDTCYAEHCEWVVITDSTSNPCDQLTADFEASINGNSVTFFGSAGPGNITYQWLFGDGTTGYGQNAAHAYAVPGSYWVCLVAWTYNPNTQDTCSTDHCEWVIIQGGSPCDSLNAGFQATTSGNTATFWSASNNNQFYQWSFGDGTFAYAPNPTHTYSGPGQYHACLMTWTYNQQTQDSCYAEHCEWVVINGGGSPCDSLNADFQASVNGNSVTFFGSAGPGNITYQWLFGDGTTGYGQNAAHAYAVPGSYWVCLVAWTYNPNTQDTCSTDHCEWVIIQGGSPCDSLNAGFQATTSGNTATFWSASNNNQFYQWSFGDGTFAYAPNPTHTYSGPGQYHACLMTWTYNQQTQDSCYAEHCEWVVINGGGSPCDSLNADFQASVNGNSVTFFGSAGPGNITYQWLFGDGTTGYGQNAAHAYTVPGSYWVCLVAWTYNPNTQDTCSTDHCEWVIIQNGSPCDSLNAGFQATTSGNTATFWSASNSNQFYQWSFGDGTFAYAPNPTHTYPGPGQYHACLMTWTYNQQSQDTCYAEHCECVIVQGGNTNPCDSLLHADFVWTAGNASIFFQDQSTTNNIPVLYYWDFGDGTSSTEHNPIHLFDQPGQHFVCLSIIAINVPDSCISTSCQWVSEFSGPTPCDSLWNASFDWSANNGVYTLWSTSAPSSAMTTLAWSVNGASLGDGTSITYQPAGDGPFTACLGVTVYSADQQVLCTSTVCDSLYLDATTSIRDEDGNSGISVYPQPFSDLLVVQATDLNGAVRITLQDMAGRLVDDRQVNMQGMTTLHYPNLPAGSYVLRISGAHGEHRLRVLRN